MEFSGRTLTLEKRANPEKWAENAPPRHDAGRCAPHCGIEPRDLMGLTWFHDTGYRTPHPTARGRNPVSGPICTW
jgi:hypothetical protein